MEKNIKDFNYYEKLFLRITLILIGIGFTLIGLLLLLADYIDTIASGITGLVVILLFSSYGVFFLSIIRIVKYVFSVKKRNAGSTIKQSIITLLISPIAILVYYAIIFILSISSCTIQ